MPAAASARRSTSGAAARRSCRAKAAPAVTAAAAHAATAPAGRPRPDRDEMASIPADADAASRTVPPRSAPRPRSSWPSSRVRLVRGSRYQPATTASKPTGTLMRNTQRQPTVPTRTPPTTGPHARPTAWAAAWIPSAARRLRAGTLVTTSATLFACSSAAPAAWTTRSTISTPSEGASPQAADAPANSTNPYR